MELWRLAAHRHWLTLRLFGREVRLCARCSGYLLGLVTATALRRFPGLPFFYSLDVQLQLLFGLLLSAPLVLDWVSQSWGWRRSNNGLRLTTGALLGAGVSLIWSVDSTPIARTVIFAYYAAAVAMTGSLGGLLLGSSARSQERPVGRTEDRSR